MDAFELDRAIAGDYSEFSRQFTEPRAPDILAHLREARERGDFTPEPLVQISPAYKAGGTVPDLVANGTLHPGCAQAFAGDEERPFRLYRHQEDAYAISAERRSFCVLTGTGSGKSMCYWLPIVDDVLRRKERGQARGVSAVVVYPMNALVKSQHRELVRYLGDDGGVTFGVYTSATSQDERDRLADSPPDILLTNYVMLDLVMTRQNERDRRIVDACSGLRFFVLDEMHTYRGRQGADVAMLVRRVRERVGADDLIHVGTSATMSDGDGGDRVAAVSDVASRLFGVPVDPADVIEETLDHRTRGDGGDLAEAVRRGVPTDASDDDLRLHPLCAWIETTLGIVDETGAGDWRRARPDTLTKAVSRLVDATGIDHDACLAALTHALLVMSRPERDRTGADGASDRAFAPMRVHRFLSGAGELNATLPVEGVRSLTLDPQVYDPVTRRRLYGTRFHACGQEAHPVRYERRRFLPRAPDETDDPDDREDEGVLEWGVLVPVGDGDLDPETEGGPPTLHPDAVTARHPDTWFTPKGVPTKAAAPRIARLVGVAGDGAETEPHAPGAALAWFLPGRPAFCPRCGERADSDRERTFLTGLSGEGRSSATTTLMRSCLERLDDGDGDGGTRRKVLVFSDNRQDAALQAAAFTDAARVTLLRGALLRALRDGPVSPSDAGRRVFGAMGLDDPARRDVWLTAPGLMGPRFERVRGGMHTVLEHLVWRDCRAGWRRTAPNLLGVGLVRFEWTSLDAVVMDPRWSGADIHPALRDASPAERAAAMTALLDRMTAGLCVDVPALDPDVLRDADGRLRGQVADEWLVDPEDAGRVADAWPVRPRGSGRSGHGMSLATGSAVHKALTRGPWRNHRKDYKRLLCDLLRLCLDAGYVQETDTVRTREDRRRRNPRDVPIPDGPNGELWGSGFRVLSDAVRIAPVPDDERPDDGGRFGHFRALYATTAARLADDPEAVLTLEAEEHTAQVTETMREDREKRFRFDRFDREALGPGAKPLPAMVCSPTMELGVDISELDAVILRNVPPTPANYAQRAGRAGRAGRAAVAVTYCHTRSPHDRWHFQDVSGMVSGEVRTPALDPSDEALVRAHVNAVWLAETRVELPARVHQAVHLPDDDLPLLETLRAALADDGAATRAVGRACRVLSDVLPAIRGPAPPWAGDVEGTVRAWVAEAPERFDRAFDRWRDMLRSAYAQQAAGHRIAESRSVSADERKAGERQASDAGSMVTHLTTDEGYESDYATYRHLATEGFLPGYAFPRLPVRAFVRGKARGRGSKPESESIQRARFLAVSEFAPGAIVYHEGAQHRVNRVVLSPTSRPRDGSSGLALTDHVACGTCGAGYDVSETRNACDCGASLDDAPTIRNCLRVEHVGTKRAERITSNDEERRRAGHDLRTIHRATGGRHPVADVPGLGRMTYLPTARLSRINAGPKRRDGASEGFPIDPLNGTWVGDVAAGPDGTPAGEARARAVPVRPVVDDTRNAVVVVADPTIAGLEVEERNGVIASLSQALKRAIEIECQLEEGEIAVEPVPSADDRRGLLLYEAVEGGAGVLARYARDPALRARIARRALTTIHLDVPADAPVPDVPDEKPDAGCVSGCYRCLLSYANQPDHERIDRTHPLLVAALVAAVREGEGHVAPDVATPPPSDGPTHPPAAASAPDPTTDGGAGDVVSRDDDLRLVTLRPGADPGPWEDLGYEVELAEDAA